MKVFFSLILLWRNALSFHSSSRPCRSRGRCLHQQAADWSSLASEWAQRNRDVDEEDMAQKYASQLMVQKPPLYGNAPVAPAPSVVQAWEPAVPPTPTTVPSYSNPPTFTSSTVPATTSAVGSTLAPDSTPVKKSASAKAVKPTSSRGFVPPKRHESYAEPLPREGLQRRTMVFGGMGALVSAFLGASTSNIRSEEPPRAPREWPSFKREEPLMKLPKLEAPSFLNDSIGKLESRASSFQMPKLGNGVEGESSFQLPKFGGEGTTSFQMPKFGDDSQTPIASERRWSDFGFQKTKLPSLDEMFPAIERKERVKDVRPRLSESIPQPQFDSPFRRVDGGQSPGEKNFWNPLKNLFGGSEPEAPKIDVAAEPTSPSLFNMPVVTDSPPPPAAIPQISPPSTNETPPMGASSPDTGLLKPAGTD